MQCYKCNRKPIENNLSMIPADPKGTKNRRWVCMKCATVVEKNTVDEEVKNISKLFDKSFNY